MLERAIAALKEQGSKASSGSTTTSSKASGSADAPAKSPADATSRSVADLEKQAEKLESLAQELRKQLHALKPAAK